MTRPQHARPLSMLLALAVAVAMLATAQPAQADHQNCGEEYPEGTLASAYPDLATGSKMGWAGQTALNDIDDAVAESTAKKTALLDSAGVLVSTAEILTEKAASLRKALPDPAEEVALPIEIADEAVRAAAIVVTFAGLIALIAETANLSTQHELDEAVAGENACNSTIMGDMAVELWVATVERNLASDGPPLAVLLSPTDSEEPGGDSGKWPLQPQHEKEDFAWCPEIDLPAELPRPAASTDLDEPNGPSTGGDCSPTFLDGMLDDPYDGAPPLTVQAIVRDTIAHAKAHGLPVRNAQDEYDQAVSLVGAKRYKDAFTHFRLAYQAAAGFDG